MNCSSNLSQNLFPITDTGTQIFDRPINQNAATVNTQGSRLNKSYSIFSSRKNAISKTHAKKFVAPVLKSPFDEIDVDNVLKSQYSLIASSPTISQRNTPNCFQVPHLPNKNNSNFFKVLNNCVQAAPQSQNFLDRLNKVDKLVSKNRRLTFPNESREKSSVSPNIFDAFQTIQKPSSILSAVVPETPETSFYTSEKENLNSDLINNSDDEYHGEIYGPCLQTPKRITLPPVNSTNDYSKCTEQLRSVDEIPQHYRSIFEKIPYFNIVQSKVFDDAFYTDHSLVVCAPTGSGKTVVFELAIVRLLINCEKLMSSKCLSKRAQPKIVYMAPIKALCSERHEDWSMKFQCLGLSCQELTGDSDVDEFWQLQKADVILTTPEKWDSMTRRWRDNSSLVRQVKLFLIDEVHLLNDESRGATMEAVVSRMKTIQASLNSGDGKSCCCFRFVAVSATIPNTEDIAEWLQSRENPALSFSMDDSYRPVTLRKVVLGYPWSSNGSEFKFDISLNYKLGNVIQTYSDSKPTLVFCSTRKSVEQAASILAKDVNFVLDARHKQALTQTANLVRNNRLRDLLLKGIGYHHAGLDAHDRRLTEELFTQGELLVLVSTSTLAMGVNLPAHLVVVKSTCHYVKGMFQEYSQSEILQMIGRAGRPQFDTTATAVIMTRNQSRNLYMNLVNGTQRIESSLHKNLIEHLNAEIVLSTIHDVTVVLEWIRSTFLYIRLLKNPTHYGYPAKLTKEEAEKRLHELCMKDLNSLTATNLVAMDNELRLLPSEPGRLMARYSIAFETMKKFSNLSGKENHSELIEILSSIHEFRDITLRMNERNSLNKMNKDKNRMTIRYPLNGKIKTTAMKVNCLMQATLGCVSVQDFALTQDVNKIFRNAARVVLCLVGLQMLSDHFKLLYSAVLLAKCIKARLWENSRYVTRQLPSIGATLSNALANAGICSFEKLEATDPREIELILNRHPPFGNHLREAVKCLPKYSVLVEQGKRYRTDACEVTVRVILNNPDDLKDRKTAGARHGCVLLIGDADNKALIKQRLSDIQLLGCEQYSWQRTLTVTRATKGDELSVNLISQEWVGLDVESTYTPYYLGPRRVIATSSGTRTDVGSKESKYFDKKKKPCRHSCINKMTCAHECCKVQDDGSTRARSTKATNQTQAQLDSSKPSVEQLHKFKYKPVKCSPQISEHSNQVVPSTPSLQRSKGWEHLDSFCDYQQTQDDVDETEMLKSVSAFEREQSYYDEQINIGSRIKHGDGGVGGERPVEQLWSEDAPTQGLVVSYEDNIEIIRPRSTKHGSYNLPDGRNSRGEQNEQIRSRMGKVFAWKSSSTPKPPTKPSNGVCPPTVSPDSNHTLFKKSFSFYGKTALARDCQPRFDLSCDDDVSLQTAKRFRPTSTSRLPSQVAAQPDFLASPDRASLIASETVRGFPAGGSHSQFKFTQSMNKSSLSSGSKPPSNDRGFDLQLWEEAPNCDYQRHSSSSPKKFALLSNQAASVSPVFHAPAHALEEEDVSICCDFSLEDPDEDEIMMEACLQAEKSKEDSKQTTGLISAKANTNPPQSNDDFMPTSSKNFTQFYQRTSQISKEKASDIADARKMFDSIFDGIF